jgi:hypothetical protein
MLLLFLIDCFHLFVYCIHNVSLQEEVVDIWHIKESKANISILVIFKVCNLKQLGWILICSYTMHKHILYVAQCVVEAFENELKLNVQHSKHLFIALNNQVNKGSW